MNENTEASCDQLKPVSCILQFDTTAATLLDRAFIRNPKYQYLKDIWCAGHFGVLYERNVGHAPYGSTLNRIATRTSY